MFATIRWFAGTGQSQDEVADTCSDLAATMRQTPGFVAFLILNASDSVFAWISLFEDRTSLESADALAALWAAHNLATSAITPPQAVTGEIVIQRGL